ncbi:hypothetical protein [Virgibacillus doumboii]|uniref:hypothetical protein n=1 Tax=Virgibacillus doumboii TaxID=2697503 RepID=UPI0013E0311B|nr:hypothetical protein [Virgibacillus doumboii]
MKKLVLVVIVAGIGIAIYFMIHESPEEQAVETVDIFYKFEQDGDFSDSWSMFHPFMKEKFDKGHYIQDRAHVFMNHFGVTSFTYTVGESTKIQNWKMEKGAETIGVVYKVSVSQVFKGKYGNFTLTQDVFVTKVDEEWKVLWNYKK